MTFPDSKYSDIASYCDDYFQQTKTAAASVDRNCLAEAAELLEAAYQRGATLFVCGNGGSAAIANTFVCDHAKLIQTDTDLVPRVVSLSDNIPMMTAIANDTSYDEIFIYQLRSSARLGDVLLSVSASGDSENIVKAVTWARQNKIDVIAFTGFDGGRSGELASVHIHVEADNYGVIEDTHQSLMHILAHFIRQNRMSEGLIAGRKF